MVLYYDLGFYQWFEGMVSLVLACSLLGTAVLYFDISIHRGEIIQRALGVSFDRLAAFSPTDRADLSMLVL